MIWVFLIVFLILSYMHSVKGNKSKNPYIKIHEHKINNDKLYSKYLNWCLKNNEIPMDKFKFIKEVYNKEELIKKITE